MPYKIRVKDGKHCVYNAKTGADVHCHDTQKKALAHQRALMVNVEDATMDIYHGLHVDLFATRGEDTVAELILRGEPICILPKEKFFDHWGQEREIDDSVISEFVASWQNRLKKGIRRSRVAVDVDHDRRAIGWFKDILPVDGGLGAAFTWTTRGRKILGGDEYAYFSPTIYWSMTDRKTGKKVRNQIGGGALTNYPYFGEVTALMSLGMYAAVLKKEGDGRSYPMRAYLVVEDPSKVLTWHLRVMSHEGGGLALDHDLMGSVKATLGKRYQGPQKMEALEKLKGLCKQEGLDFSLIGGISMAGNGDGNGDQEPQLNVFQRVGLALLTRGADGDGDVGELGLAPLVGTPLEKAPDKELLALKGEVEKLTDRVKGLTKRAKVEQAEYTLNVKKMQGDLNTAEAARQLQEYRATALAKFSHLPGSVDELAMHVHWLHGADTGKKQPHAKFFMALLEAADDQFSKVFRELGVGASGKEADSFAVIDRKARKYMEKNEGVEYDEAVSFVISEEPGLYAEYERQLKENAK